LKAPVTKLVRPLAAEPEFELMLKSARKRASENDGNMDRKWRSFEIERLIKGRPPLGDLIRAPTRGAPTVQKVFVGAAPVAALWATSSGRPQGAPLRFRRCL
jgi:hypothetical protein